MARIDLLTTDELADSRADLNTMFAELYARNPPRIAGRWYTPYANARTATTTNAPATTNISFLPPFILPEGVTINSLGAFMTTAGTNAQFGWYAMDLTTGFMTGAPVIKTGSIDVSGGAGHKTGALSAGDTAVPVGWYWPGLMVDNSAVRFQVLDTQIEYAAFSVGDDTLTDMQAAQNTGSFSHYVTGQTYGTWPDLTGVTPTSELVYRGALQHYKVAT